jgi:ubiquinone/menaquinone biosynthesis C-methylase UbiE
MSTFEPKQFKEGQRQGWDNSAVGWYKWWKITESAGRDVTQRMLELAHIKRGSKVPDVATGIGEPSISAAKRVGKSGHVLAIDLSNQMLSVATNRAISLNLQDIIEFREGDLETIDLPNLAFDAGLCRFGLMFSPILKGGLSNIYKSLIDGGLFSAVVWASPEKVPFISLPLNLLIKINNQMFPTNSPGPFSLSNENSLRDSFIQSGYKDVTTERHDMIFNFNSAEEYTNFVYETTFPVQVFLTKQPPEKRGEILNKITKEVSTKYADKGSGSVTLNNEAICNTGRK